MPADLFEATSAHNAGAPGARERTPLGVASQSVSYRRNNGVYYTPVELASFLTEWAIRASTDNVFDPSYGGCVFLAAAVEDLERLGAAEAGYHVYGVDIDPNAWDYGKKMAALGIPAANLIQRDFLAVRPCELPQMDAVIGNPPYVRHHRLSVQSIDAAQGAITRAGLSLSKRAGYWAYFVLHSIQFLAPDGRIALVLPGALLHVDYAEEVRKALGQSFQHLRVISLPSRLFAETDEETILVLGEGKGKPPRDASFIEVQTLKDLEAAVAGSNTKRILSPELGIPWQQSLVDEGSRLILNDVVETGCGNHLGELAMVRIGCVTGANQYFVIDSKTKQQWDIPDDCVRPITTHSAQLKERLEVDQGLVDSIINSGGRALLVVPPRPSDSVAPGLARYYADGEAKEINKRTKCMQRSPWFNLVDYHPPDAFFTYMSWAAPKIVLNWTQADCTNAMHRLYWTELGQTTKPEAIALSMLSSVVQLQIEMYGRSYGGGVLKMEPRQVRSLWLPQLSGEIADLFAEVCKLLKRGESGAVTRLVDAAIDERLGISADKLQSLRQEFTRLRARRLRRKGSVLRPAGRPHDTVQGRGA